MRTHILLIAVVILAVLAGCGGAGSSNKNIVVYSPHGKLLPEVKKRFEAAHPGYTVNFQDMGGGVIFDKVNAEKSLPRADIWFGGSPGDFNRAEALGLLEPYTPDWTKTALPADAKSPTGGWVATFRTPQVILYNPKKISESELPKTWDELLDPKWKGKIAIRDVRASAGMKTFLGAIIQREQKRAGNVDDGFKWLKRLDQNTGYYAANPTVLFDVLSADGPYALSVWNLPEALTYKEEGRPIRYFIPQETVVLVEPVAILKGAPNPAGARLFHDFVNSPGELATLAKERFRIPARTDLPLSAQPPWLAELKITPMPIDWATLSAHLDEWVARWDAEIKSRKN